MLKQNSELRDDPKLIVTWWPDLPLFEVSTPLIGLQRDFLCMRHGLGRRVAFLSLSSMVSRGGLATILAVYKYFWGVLYCQCPQYLAYTAPFHTTESPLVGNLLIHLTLPTVRRCLRYAIF